VPISPEITVAVQKQITATNGTTVIECINFNSILNGLTITSWCQSLAESVVLLHLLQNNVAKNPYSLKPVNSWKVENQNDTSITLNGLFSASIELPLIQSFDGSTGNLILSGASPMGALS
jgi:hypothetical protein